MTNAWTLLWINLLEQYKQFRERFSIVQHIDTIVTVINLVVNFSSRYWSADATRDDDG